jgi:CBS domain-containing protein
MSADVKTIPADATIADARACMLTGGHSAYPIVDAAGRCIAVVSRSDLFGIQASDRPAVELASTDVVSIGPDATVREALGMMLSEEVEHLPVVDAGGSLVGMCTRTDVLRAKSPLYVQEQRDDGWVTSALR